MASVSAKPSYKHHVVENYGTFFSNGQFQIKGGLNYVEHGTSDLENLQMFGGDIKVEPMQIPLSTSRSSAPSTSSPLSPSAQMGVRGSLTGTIKDFSVADNGHFIGNTLSFGPLQNFRLEPEATFYSPNSFHLDVERKYGNKGQLSSSREIDIHVNDDTKDLGLVIAKEKRGLLFKRQSQLQNQIRSAAQNENNTEPYLFLENKLFITTSISIQSQIITK